MISPSFLWAVEQANQHGFSTTERCVWFILVERANSTRVCWPSVAGLVRDTASSRAAVFKALAKFRALDLIRVEPRHEKSETSFYHVNRPATAGESPTETPPPPPSPMETPPSPTETPPPSPCETQKEYNKEVRLREANASLRAAPERVAPGPDLFGAEAVAQPARAAPRPRRPTDPEVDRLWAEGQPRLAAIVPCWTAKQRRDALGRMLKQTLGAVWPIWPTLDALERERPDDPWPFLTATLAWQMRQPPPRRREAEYVPPEFNHENWMERRARREAPEGVWQ